MLLPRVLTAVVGLPLLLLFIHIGSIPFTALVLTITILALYEYGLLLWMGGRAIQRWILTIGGGLLAAAVVSGSLPGGSERSGEAPLVPMMVLAVLLATVLREMLRKERSLERASLTLFGIFFIGWSLAHLSLLRDLNPYGERFTFFLFGTIWVTDTAAYFAGHHIGARRLAPILSPKKTWEGAIAGLAAAVGFAALAHRTFLAGLLGTGEALGIGFLASVTGQLSDLAESMVKRAVGAKDSSNLLPGHGGVLDRFDSFLLTAPVLYYTVLLALHPE